MKNKALLAADAAAFSCTQVSHNGGHLAGM